MKKLIFILLFILASCSTPAEKLLTKINDDCNYRSKNCRTIADQKVAILTNMGIKAEVVHCEARDTYEWDHATVKATIEGQEWILDNGMIIDVPWKYSEVKKYCYDFILP
jgi:hypothetical protein